MALIQYTLVKKKSFLSTESQTIGANIPNPTEFLWISEVKPQNLQKQFIAE